MRGWLGVLLLALVGLGGIDAWIRHEREVRRVGDGILRPLVDPARQIVPERVRVVKLRAPGTRGDWRYERRGDTWRFPAYFDAYVHGDRMGSFLRVVLGASGTRATGDADDHDELGVTEREGLRVTFEGSDGPLVHFLLGRPIPGPGGEEIYARLDGDDLVLHLHANPVRLLGGGQPPLLDPHLLPQAERRRAITRVRVLSDSQSYLIRRVLAPLPENASPFPLYERDRYRWVLERESRVDTCVDASVYTWLAWLRSVRFERLVDPDDDGYGLGSAGEVELTDEEDTIDRLQVGRAAGGGPAVVDAVYVGNRVAHLVTVMPAARAQWLLPPASLLLEPLANPSPFESIP